jgi:hypothetical protein
MSWSGTGIPTDVKIDGESALVTFKMPIDKALAAAAIACHIVKEKRAIAIALFPEMAEVDPAEIDVDKLAARANQTSWGQALNERLTGQGPKEKKE